jgi:hypothetical protein
MTHNLIQNATGKELPAQTRSRRWDDGFLASLIAA